MDSNVAVFAFSADPITIGHVDILTRAAKLFDKIIVATVPETKKSNWLFSYDARQHMIEMLVNEHPILKKNCVASRFAITNTTVKFCKGNRANYLIRGIRGYTDLDYEYKLAYLNRQLSDNKLETIFIPGDPNLSMFSSTTVREFMRLNNSYWKKLVPEEILDYLEQLVKVRHLRGDFDND